uniref:Uncharacterized protein n=1 Tax=Engystomops pustulosus TaxID=76066 RepID=A0AAV6Z2C9_ENGPU|nr:hypothetical protein GDO81_029004 [Engystomops pustulosus]
MVVGKCHSYCWVMGTCHNGGSVWRRWQWRRMMRGRWWCCRCCSRRRFSYQIYRCVLGPGGLTSPGRGGSHVWSFLCAGGAGAGLSALW